MKFPLQNINWKALVLYIVPLFYIYVQILRDFLNLATTDSMGSRTNSLIIVSLIGFFLANKTSLKGLEKSAILFVSYMSLMAFIGETSNIFTYVSCLFIWVLALYTGNRLTLSRKDLTMIGYVGGLMCSLLSVFYITLSNLDIYSSFSYENAIASYNSIYYVLIAFPFLFLVPNKLHTALFSVLPVIAFVSSAKSTCIITAAICILYYFYSSRKEISFSKKIVLSFLSVLGVAYWVSNAGMSEISEGIMEDVDSGGNGRTDIASQVIYLFFNDCSLSEMVFGNGVNAVSRKLHIGAHNDFLETLYCFGFIGLLMYLKFIYDLIKQLKYMKNDLTIKNAYIISIIVFLCASFASKMLGTQMQMILPSLFWGLTTKYELYENSTNNSIR